MPQDPLKPEKKEPEVKVEIQQPEPEKQIVINPEPVKQEPRVVTFEDFDKLNKRMEYQTRLIEKTFRQTPQYVAPQQPIQQPQIISKSDPEFDSEVDNIAQTNYQKAINMLSYRQGKKAAEEYFKELVEKNQVEIQRLESEKILNASKSKVLKEEPDIMDETSEKARIYMEVMNEDPDILRNPRGPELAMYRMRERLGITKQPAIKQQVDQEVARRTRIGAGSLPQGRPADSDNRIVLTPDEQIFCDERGIPYDRYNRMRKLGEKGFKEGVTYNAKS